MDVFLFKVLQCHCANRFELQSVLLQQNLELLQPRFFEDVALLYMGSLKLYNLGHWICVHYNNKMINVYDSLGTNLSARELKNLAAMYPSAEQVKHHSVQRQPNGFVCGVFAIAFASAIALNLDPTELGLYLDVDTHNLSVGTTTIRKHLWHMIETGCLAPFPTIQNQCDIRRTTVECRYTNINKATQEKCQTPGAAAPSKYQGVVDNDAQTGVCGQAHRKGVRDNISRCISGLPTTSSRRKDTRDRRAYMREYRSKNPDLHDRKCYMRNYYLSKVQTQNRCVGSELSGPSQHHNIDPFDPKTTAKSQKHSCQPQPAKTSRPLRETPVEVKRNIMALNEDLSVSTVDFFLLQLLKPQSCNRLSPQSVRLQDLPYLLEKRNTEDILILKQNCHPRTKQYYWTCVHYRNKRLFVYNCFNQRLGLKEIDIIQKVYACIDEITYVKVQTTPNPVSSGTLAIAFATSLFFKQDPAKTEYLHDSTNKELTRKFRQHLLRMFSSNKLILFPAIPKRFPREHQANGEAPLSCSECGSVVEDRHLCRHCTRHIEKTSGYVGDEENHHLYEETASYYTDRGSDTDESLPCAVSNMAESYDDSERRKACNTRCPKEKRPVTWEEAVASFEIAIRAIPDAVCQACGRLWYITSMEMLPKTDAMNMGLTDEFIDKVYNLQEGNFLNHFCFSCMTAIKCGRIPSLALSNGLQFPEVDPIIKDLTRLEERLVAWRHMFQSLWTVRGPCGQYRTKGGIVNVPVNMDTTVRLLPRPLNDSNVVHIRLARRLEYKSDYLRGNVRLAKTFNAASILVTKSLYMHHNIVLQSDWLDDNRSDEQAHEPYDLLPDLNEETLLVGDMGLRIAPAAGFHPISILLDKDSEYLAFVQIYGGHKFTPIHNDKPLSYGNICKSVFMRYDRRAAVRHDYILFAAKKLELLKLVSNISICLRKKKSPYHQASELVAKNILRSDFVNSLIQHDDAFQVFNGIRHSGQHWRKEKMNVVAMVRQYGMPSIFLTVSAAETHWPEFIVLLKKVVDGQLLTENEAQALPINEKLKLLQKDPITSAKYFTRRLAALMTTWSATNGPFENHRLLHYYYRLEVQQRGSLHCHLIAWLENAPVFDPSDASTMEKCTAFADKLVSSSSTAHPECAPFIPYQTHRHTFTCQNNRSKTCRFGIPFFPLDETVILAPLPPDIPPRYVKLNADNLTKVRQLLVAPQLAEISTFPEFLEKLNMSRQAYIFALRFSLKKHKIIYKRDIRDVNVNNFSPKILSLMRSNCDFQFILDPFSVCSYIVEYINKSDRGMSAAVKQILSQLREGNTSLKERLKKVTNYFYNKSELSVQEAAMDIMQIPLSKSSAQVIYLPTGPPNERVQFFKQPDNVRHLDPESDEVFESNILDYYSWRPACLDHFCFADFAAWYQVSKKRIPVNSCSRTNATNTGNEDNNLLGNAFNFHKRTFARVIRFKSYSPNKDPHNYYRMLLMLYLPWRNEETELIDIDCKLKCEQNSIVIKNNRKKYNKFEDHFLEELIEDVGSTVEEVPDDATHCDREKQFDIDAFELGEENNDTDVFRTADPNSTYVESFTSPLKLDKAAFNSLIGELNIGQRDYLLHVCSIFKDPKDNQFLHYVGGSAGTGKSKLISALYQSVTRIFNKDKDVDPDLPIVLLTAPTGKAAFNINGLTLHQAFKFPFQQKDAHELSSDMSNTMASHLKHLKLVIIDEISMVAEHHFRMIDQRLRHLFDERLPFGGVCIIVVGDFNQLPPVKGKPLYGTVSSNPYVEVFGRPLWHLFQYYELTEVMRQNEKPFIQALNNLAAGSLTPENIQILKNRCFKEAPVECEALHPIHLFYRNVDVKAWNQSKLKELPGEEVIAIADDVVVGEGPSYARTSLLRWASAPTRAESETGNLQRQLTLKVGGMYMLTRNLNTSDGLVNGSPGILRRIDLGRHPITQACRPLRMWIEFLNPTTGAVIRGRYHNVMRTLGIAASWTPIELHIATFTRNENSQYNLQVERKMFPITEAMALTIHKSQGASYSIVVVHIYPGMNRALLYVCLSRAQSIDGLFIVGEFTVPSTNTPGFKILEKERIRWTEHRLVPRFRFLHEPRSLRQLIFHNVQSYLAHKREIINNRSFTDCDFLLLGETWTTPSDLYNVPGFTCVSRVDDATARLPKGSACLVSQTAASSYASWFSTLIPSARGSISIASIKGDILIVCIYRTPHASLQDLRSAMLKIRGDNTSKKLVIGDFNVDWSKPSASRQLLLEYFQLAGLQVQNSDSSTTDAGSILDIVATNYPINSGTFESVTSFHKPIWVRF